MSELERVLIVEDEQPMRRALADALTASGYRVMTAEDGAAGLEMALREKPDLLLLDVMMPGLDGFAVCGELRRLGARMAILFLTAKGMVRDRVTGLNAGADDYLVKPFSTEELLARVRAVLRRARREATVLERLILGDVEIHFGQRSVSRGGKLIHLTTKEFAMMRVLAEQRGHPVSRERFLDVAWGHAAFPTTRTVDNHMASLRAKLEEDPEKPRFLLTVHGVGYRLSEE